MSDFELLELAAKAIGFTLWKNRAGAFQLFEGPHLNGDGKYVSFWKPLTDDGDALRLAVQLELNLVLAMEQSSARNASFTGWIDQSATDNPFAAARRAIVRAAAEIGGSMQ